MSATSPEAPRKPIPGIFNQGTKENVGAKFKFLISFQLKPDSLTKENGGAKFKFQLYFLVEAVGEAGHRDGGMSSHLCPPSPITSLP